MSYAREDRAHAERLAHVLEAQGWSVWWDLKIAAGKDWRKVLKAELRAARCAIVIWSHLSVESDYVQDEAEDAADRGMLVPVFIEPVKAPLGLRKIQGVELFDWNGASAAPGFQKLVQDIRNLLATADAATVPAHAAERAPSTEAATVGAQVEAIAAGARAALGKPERAPLVDADWAELAELEVAYCGIGDAGLRFIAAAASLKYLDLTGNCIGDAGLEHIARLSNLEYLDVSGNANISDAGLAQLRANRCLKHLNLSATAVRGAGLQHLAALPALRELVLRATRLSPDSTRALQAFPALTRLELANTPLDDAAVPALERLVRLEFLGLRHTRISERQRDRLRRALLKCRVAT